MTKEQAKHEIISVFSEAGKGIHEWIEYLDERPDLEKLLEVSAIVKKMKEVALGRQKEKIG